MMDSSPQSPELSRSDELRLEQQRLARLAATRPHRVAWLEKIRTDRKLSRKEFSRLMGCRGTWWTDVLRGSMHPRVQHMERGAAMLGWRLPWQPELGEPELTNVGQPGPVVDKQAASTPSDCGAPE